MIVEVYLWWLIFFDPVQVSLVSDVMHPGRLTVLPLVQNKVAPFAVAQKSCGVVGFVGIC